MAVKFEDVRKFAMTLDGVEEGTSYGTAAFKVRGALFVRLKEDGETLVVRMGFDARDEMIATAPEIYFVTDHYLKYKWILVRMQKIELDAMRDLLRGAWKLAASEKSAAKKEASTGVASEGPQAEACATDFGPSRSVSDGMMRQILLVT